MTTKNWLIRTTANYIFGPVTKDKIIELYKNGSIHPDDEVCYGNGFWFFVREDDLVEKYLLQNNENDSLVEEENSKEAKVTFEIEENTEDETLIDLHLNDIQQTANVVNKDNVEFLVKDQSSSSLDNEVFFDSEKVEKSDIKESPDESHRFNEETLNKNNQHESEKPQDKSSYLKHHFMKLLTIFLCLVVILLIFFRRRILHSILNHPQKISVINNTLIPHANAQDRLLFKKKI